MLKFGHKILSVLLTTVAVVTFVNVLVMYWFPINIPLSSFFAVRFTFVAYIEKRYYLLILSILACGLLLFSAGSVHRERCFLPIISFLYVVFDFAAVLSLLIKGLLDGHWVTYIGWTMVSIVMIVLFCIYFRTRSGKRNKKIGETGSEPLA